MLYHFAICTLLLVSGMPIFECKVAPVPAPVPAPVKKGGCGRDACEPIMSSTTNMNPLSIPACSACTGVTACPACQTTAWHVPDISTTTGNTWTSVDNPVNTYKMVTTTPSGQKTNVEYGGFCAPVKKTTPAIFLRSVAMDLPVPSWFNGNLKNDIVNFVLPGGAVYKIDVTHADVVAMNNAAKQCQSLCASITGCKFASYGYEPASAVPATTDWFCKTFTVNACTDPLNLWWKPAPPTVTPPITPITVVNVAGTPGGCRVTDTIPTTTPTLSATSQKISASPISFTPSLPYLTAGAVPGVVASIRCDAVLGALTPGWPTFGTTWV